MSDPETRGAILFLSLLGLAVAVCLLGFFTLARLRRRRGGGDLAKGLTIGQAVGTVLLLAIAFLSTFLPPVALVPALMFFILGLRLLFGADSRDGGVVLLLAGIAWGLFMAIQADTLASGADIRVDLLLTLPVMTSIGSLGWRIQASQP
jgi:hypothetical protein